MWYDVPNVNATAWLLNVVDLFFQTVDLVMEQPLLCVFVAFLIFLMTFAVFYSLTRIGRRK